MAPGAPRAGGRLTPQVREAVALAIDHPGLIEAALGAAGRPQASPVPNGFPGAEDLAAPRQDAARATALLAEAGHGGGLDLDLAFPAINSYGADLSVAAHKLQQDLARVRVRLRLQPLATAVRMEQVRAGQLPMTIGYYAPTTSAPPSTCDSSA